MVPARCDKEPPPSRQLLRFQHMINPFCGDAGEILAIAACAPRPDLGRREWCVRKPRTAELGKFSSIHAAQERRTTQQTLAQPAANAAAAAKVSFCAERWRGRSGSPGLGP